VSGQKKKFTIGGTLPPTVCRVKNHITKMCGRVRAQRHIFLISKAGGGCQLNAYIALLPRK